MRHVNHFQYVQKIRHALLAAGEEGITQHNLNQKTRTKIFTSTDLDLVLEGFKQRRWVEEFRVRRLTKHRIIMWRATTLLRDDWQPMVEGELPTGPAVELPASQLGSTDQDASRS